MTSSELIALKAKIKAEMKRRNGTGPTSGKKTTPTSAVIAARGPLDTYAGTAYDFTHTPAKDGRIYAEYGEKTVDLLLKIKPYGDLTETKSGSPIPVSFNSDLTSYVSTLAAEAFTGETTKTYNARKSAGESMSSYSIETSSCNAACTGLCIGSCVGMCNGCVSTCTASCGSGCAGSLRVASYG